MKSAEEWVNEIMHASTFDCKVEVVRKIQKEYYVKGGDDYHESTKEIESKYDKEQYAPDYWEKRCRKSEVLLEKAIEQSSRGFEMADKYINKCDGLMDEIRKLRK